MPRWRNVAVVGAQWGDEGKGKIVDWLSERADVVVRFQGGHNAGHTLVIGNVEYKLSLLPSGVVRPGKLSIIGNGVVVDPWALLAEIETMRGKGLDDLARDSEARRQRGADPAVARRARPRARGAARRPARSAPPAAASARPMRTRSAAARCGSATSPTRRRSKTRVDDLLLHHNALLRGLDAPEVDRGRAAGRAARDRAASPALCRAGLAAARRGAPRRPPHPVRGRAGRDARCRSRHLSVCHLVEHGGRAGGGRVGHRAVGDRLCARHHQGLHDAGRQRPVPDRADRRDRPDPRRARPRVRHRHRAAAALRLVRRGGGAPGGQDRRDRRHRADQARRARRVRRDQVLHRLSPRRRNLRLCPGRH